MAHWICGKFAEIRTNSREFVRIRSEFPENLGIFRPNSREFARIRTNSSESIRIRGTKKDQYFRISENPEFVIFFGLFPEIFPNFFQKDDLVFFSRIRPNFSGILPELL